MTKVKALQPLVHNRINAVRGDEFDVDDGEARQLAERGLAKIVAEDAPQTGVTDSQEDDDLLGDGVKAEPAPKNKMEAAPVNKGKKK